MWCHVLSEECDGEENDYYDETDNGFDFNSDEAYCGVCNNSREENEVYRNTQSVQSDYITVSVARCCQCVS